MKKVFLALFVIIHITACNTMKPQEDNGDSQTAWTDLFDGSDMEQWRGYLMSEMPSEWTIEDGAMVFTPGKKGGKNIITKEKFTSFVLSLEWKISEGGNSGIFWGVSEEMKLGEPYHTGPEIQVLDNYGHADGKHKLHTAGSLYDLIGVPKTATKPVGEWNVCVLEINQNINLGRMSLNGTEFFTFPLYGDKWDALVANSKFADWEGFGKYRTGHIGLQDHGDKVWYRNIKIEKLD